MTFSNLRLVRQLLDDAHERFTPQNLIADYPVICFAPEITACPICGNRLKVKKTKTDRLAFTLHIGGFRVHETWLWCDSCNNRRIYRSGELKRLFPEKGNFGLFDVIEYIGRRLFLGNRTITETKSELSALNVPISDSEVGFLGEKFIAYLTIAHRLAASRLREMMRHNGGYMLHIDATCEGGGSLLLTGVDAISSTVLWNSKIPTEKAVHVTPFLRQINDLYGRPLLVVMDMSNGFENAVREVFGQDMNILICHFHFLRDIGKDLLGKEYDLIRNRLRKHGAGSKLRYRIRPMRTLVDENPKLVDNLASQAAVRESLTRDELESMPALIAYSLVQWALAGKSDGSAYGFPFDRPHMEFALRIRDAHREIEELKKAFDGNSLNSMRPLLKTAGSMRNIIDDKVLWRAVDGIKKKIDVFDKLRKAMRIAPCDGERGLNDGGGDDPIGKIEERVGKFRYSVLKDRKLSNTIEFKKMLRQIDKYWQSLFAAPVTVDTPSGRISIQPQRTNNIMEQFFRRLKRDPRRRTGDNSMARRLKTMNSNMPLVKNIENKQYMDILLDGKNP